MNNSYSISNDGTIFEIKEDGSIVKLAKIDSDGHIHALSGEIISENGRKGRNRFLIIILTIVTIVLSILYAITRDNYSRAYSTLNEYKSMYENSTSVTSSLHSEINTVKQERDNVRYELSSLRNKISDTYPLVISNISIANVTYNGDIQTDFGKTLYGSNTMYLRPRIEYTGLVSGYKTLKVKWYNPDGTIRRGTSSPSGFSHSESVYVYSGDNMICTLSGWGNSTRGHWRSGTYRIEIWYNDSCLKAKTFTVY